MALAARPIVVLIRHLFNRLACDPGIRPLVELDPVERNALGADGKLANVGSHGLVEFVPAHAEVAVGVLEADKARGRG